MIIKKDGGEARAGRRAGAAGVARRRTYGHAAGLDPVRNPVLSHRVRLFTLVPLVRESNPKLQGGWCWKGRNPRPGLAYACCRRLSLPMRGQSQGLLWHP